MGEDRRDLLKAFEELRRARPDFRDLETTIRLKRPELDEIAVAILALEALESPDDVCAELLLASNPGLRRPQ